MLNRLMEHLHIDRNDPRLEMTFRWNDIIGERFRGHIKPFDIRKNILIVSCDHQAWGQLFLMDEKRILKRINSLFPALTIQRITLVLR